MFRFLEIELEVGITFAKAAENAASTEDLLHNRKLARRAYDSVLRHTSRANSTGLETKRITTRLRKLRLALFRLGDLP